MAGFSQPTYGGGGIATGFAYGNTDAADAIQRQREQQKFQGDQGAAQRKNDLALGQTAANASMYPATLKQDRFNTLFPYLQNQYAQAGQGAQTPGGQSPPGPEISVGPVWNEQQIQGQVNASRAANDQATAGRVRAINSGVGGRGLGANSPLAQALGGQAQSANLAANTQNEQQTRWGSAQGNATHLLNTQQARESQFAARQGEDIQRRIPYFQQQNALLSVLAGLA